MEDGIKIKQYFRAMNLMQLKLYKRECLRKASKIYLPQEHFTVKDVHLRSVTEFENATSTSRVTAYAGSDPSQISSTVQIGIWYKRPKFFSQLTIRQDCWWLPKDPSSLGKTSQNCSCKPHYLCIQVLTALFCTYKRYSCWNTCVGKVPVIRKWRSWTKRLTHLTNRRT